MENKNIYTIYKHTTPNGKIYIGKTKRPIQKRWANGLGYKNNEYFFRAICKYGWENIKHEILYTNLSLENANKIEIKLITENKSHLFKFGFNNTLGGDGSLGCIPNQITRNKKRMSMMGKSKGRKNTNETKEKMRIAALGRTLSAETREKISKALTGRKHSEETKLKISKAIKMIPRENKYFYGKHLSEEHKDKIRQKRIGKKHTPEAKLKMIINRESSIKIICIETNMIFNSIKEATRFLGKFQCTRCIRNSLDDNTKKAYGYHWKIYKG